MKNNYYKKIRHDFFQGYSNYPNKVKKKLFKKQVRKRLKNMLKGRLKRYNEE